MLTYKTLQDLVGPTGYVLSPRKVQGKKGKFCPSLVADNVESMVSVILDQICSKENLLGEIANLLSMLNTVYAEDGGGYVIMYWPDVLWQEEKRK